MLCFHLVCSLFYFFCSKLQGCNHAFEMLLMLLLMVHTALKPFDLFTILGRCYNNVRRPWSIWYYFPYEHRPDLFTIFLMDMFTFVIFWFNFFGISDTLQVFLFFFHDNNISDSVMCFFVVLWSIIMIGGYKSIIKIRTFFGLYPFLSQTVFGIWIWMPRSVFANFGRKIQKLRSNRS